MKRTTFRLSCSAILLLAGIAAQAVEETSWGTLKETWDGTAAPAAKLTISQAVAGGYRPGMVRIQGLFEGIAGEGAIEPLAPCGAGDSTTLSGEGALNVMGQMTAVWADCSPDGIQHSLGNAILTDGNGDELRVNYRGFDPVTDGGSSFGFVEALGGTGRYAGASGTWSYFASFELNAAGGFDHLIGYHGWIMLPNATPFIPADQDLKRGAGRKPGSLLIKASEAPFTSAPAEGGVGCGGPDTNTLEFLVASTGPVEVSPLGTVTSWEIRNCFDLDTGALVSGTGTWFLEAGTLTYVQNFIQPPQGWAFATLQQFTNGTGAYKGARGTMFVLGSCNFDENGSCVSGDGLTLGWVKGFSLD